MVEEEGAYVGGRVGVTLILPGEVPQEFVCILDEGEDDSWREGVVKAFDVEVETRGARGKAALHEGPGDGCGIDAT